MIRSIKCLVVVAVAAFFLIPTSSFARSFGEIYTDCGLGGMIGSAVDGTAGNVIAVITNITWDWGTTASSSNISSADTCANAYFIHESYDKLETEIASGEGEYLDVLITLALNESELRDEYVTKLRNDFSKIVADEEYVTLSRYEKVKRLYEIAM